jgi:hypothetical protein
VNLDMTWAERAACMNLPTSMFYPESGSRREPSPDEARAKRVCARCPVRKECLDYALTNESKSVFIRTGMVGTHQADISIKSRAWGIWGGHTAAERRHIEVRHTDDCDRQGHSACRPIHKQVQLLEELFASRAHTRRILMPDEEVRRSA